MIDFVVFLAMTAVILGVARYNENDSLFWKLFISLAGAYAAVFAVKSYIDDSKEQDKVVMISKAPTQVQESTVALFGVATPTLTATRWEKSQKPAGKDTFAIKNDSILSEVLVSIRGRPQVTSVRPILYGEPYFNDS